LFSGAGCAGRIAERLFDDFEAKFLNDRVGQDLFRQTFDLFFSNFARRAIQIQNEKLALTDVPNGVKSQGRQGVLNGLPLRIEDRTFRHYPYVSFHEGIIPSPGRRCGNEIRREAWPFLHRTKTHGGSWPPPGGQDRRMGVPYDTRGDTRRSR
jgi:hypothetical protein